MPCPAFIRRMPASADCTNYRRPIPRPHTAATPQHIALDCSSRPSPSPLLTPGGLLSPALLADSVALPSPPLRACECNTPCPWPPARRRRSMSRKKPQAPTPAVTSTACSSLMSCLSLHRHGSQQSARRMGGRAARHQRPAERRRTVARTPACPRSDCGGGSRGPGARVPARPWSGGVSCPCAGQRG
ncbi:hypothetical protein BS78_09G182400 [Paspalum vaginatum]|nr:hypothetical protein BS78_09G182400 [Paspalum vaginatum]